MTIGYAGMSHLGIVSAIVTACKGHDVVGYDAGSGRAASLDQGLLPIVEPGLREALEECRNRIRFTDGISDLSGCEVIFISLDVPTDANNRSDTTPVEQMALDAAQAASPGSTLVVLSQVPPGFTRRFAAGCGGAGGVKGLRVFYQVETLVFGNAVERALRPERFIVGGGDSACRLPRSYEEWLGGFDAPVFKMSYESAELAKISINMFLASSVTTANTLAEVCEAVGAEWSDIIPTIRADRRIGQYAYIIPGLGLSGGNLERDLATIGGLAAEFGTNASIVGAHIDNSRHRRDWVLKTFHRQVMSQQANPKIAVWGLAYKPNTMSTKNSPALSLLEALGPFSVRVYDPEAVLDADCATGVVQKSTALEACREADVLIVMTPWDEFHEVDLVQVRELMTGRVIIDPAGVLDRDRCVELGFSHATLGSPIKSSSLKNDHT